MDAAASFAQAFNRCPLVAILRGVTPCEVAAIGDVLVGAGFTVIEVPLNSPDALDSIARLAGRYGKDVIIGAGTVLSAEQVVAVARAGGTLVVSPNTDCAVIGATLAAGMVSLPGYFTVSEAFTALGAGAHALKLFPAEAASPAMVKSQCAVLPPAVPIVVTGGIDAVQMPAWRGAGADGFGLGSALYAAGRSADAVQERAARFMQALRQG